MGTFTIIKPQWIDTRSTNEISRTYIVRTRSRRNNIIIYCSYLYRRMLIRPVVYLFSLCVCARVCVCFHIRFVRPITIEQPVNYWERPIILLLYFNVNKLVKCVWRKPVVQTFVQKQLSTHLVVCTKSDYVRAFYANFYLSPFPPNILRRLGSRMGGSRKVLLSGPDFIFMILCFFFFF